MASWSLQPTTKKVIRGTIFAIVGGIVSIYAIEMGDVQATTIAIAYMLSMLLVYGVDIAKLKAGPVTIWFETDHTEQQEIDTDWNKK